MIRFPVYGHGGIPEVKYGLLHACQELETWNKSVYVLEVYFRSTEILRFGTTMGQYGWTKPTEQFKSLKGPIVWKEPAVLSLLWIDSRENALRQKLL